MKKLIPVIALLIGAYGALGQAVVNFRNDNLSQPPDRMIRQLDGTTLVYGTNFAVQLLYGTDPASLTPHPTLAYFRAISTSGVGTWSGANRTLSGIAAPPTPAPSVGPQIWLQVRAWDSGDRTRNFDQTRASGGLWGQTAVFSYQQKSSAPGDVLDTAMLNFLGFSLVPEPSVIGLGVIGIGALFLLRRRK